MSLDALGSGGTDPPGYVELRGAAPRPALAYSYVEKRSTDGPDGATIHRYVPLVTAGWRPGDPVTTVLVQRFARNLNPHPEQLPFDTTLAGGYEGKLERGPLPTWVRHGLEDRGASLAEPAWALTGLRLGGHPPGLERRGEVLPLLAGFAATIGLGTVGMMLVLGIGTRRRVLGGARR